MLGTTLAGHYKIVRHLGGGGFSQTFIAEDLHLPGNPTCIIKQLKPASAREGVLKVARDLFDKEAKVLYRLGRHDRIPSLLAHFEQDEEFFLAQEMVEGHVLSQEIRRRQSYNEAYVIALLSDLMVTLDFVHKQQVIHRDIKPSNLIRRQQDGKIVLIDFGAVKEVSTQTIAPENPESNTYSGLIIGSPGYMPNEQYGGRVQFASDIYAIGIICIQALTGLTATEIPEDQRTSEFIWRDQAIVSQDLLDIVDKMVRFDWRQRYQTALDVLHAVQEISSKIGIDDITNPVAAERIPQVIMPSAHDSITNPPSSPTRPTEESLLALSHAAEASQLISIQQICAELENFEDLVRVKKLLCLVCTGILENDPNRLDNFTLTELIEDIYSLNPTAAQLKNTLVEAVKTINLKRQKRYLYIAKTIFNEVVKLYGIQTPQSSIIPPTQAFSKQNLVSDSRDRLSSPYLQIAQELQAEPNFLRIKKLLLYICRDVWESDVNRLNQIELSDLLGEVMELAPTLKQLEVLLLDVANSLSKPVEYVAIANIIINKLNKLEKINSLHQENVATNIYENNLTDIGDPNGEFPKRQLDRDPQMETDGKQQFNREIFADLFDLRLELLRFANPLRTKILLFSVIHYPFFIHTHDWSDIRTQTLDNLLRDLFCAYTSALEAEKKLIQIAHTLDEPEQYGQVVRYIIRLLKPLYTKLTELSMRHPIEDQARFPTRKSLRTTSLTVSPKSPRDRDVTSFPKAKDVDDTCRFI